jgi:hypothetical protein
MPKTNQCSKTMQLHLIHNAVFNTLANEQLFSLFEESGGTTSMLEEGKTIYEAASLSRAAEIATADDLHETEEQLLRLQKTIRDVYAKFTDAARICFGRNILDLLGIAKCAPRSITTLCDCAQVSLKKVNEHPELASRLAENGFGKDCLQSAGSLMETYAACIVDRAKLKEQLAASSKECADAFAMIRKWLQGFSSKTYSALIGKPCLTEILDIEIKSLSEIRENTPIAA